jgi:hypothetical protein
VLPSAPQGTGSGRRDRALAVAKSIGGFPVVVARLHRTAALAIEAYAVALELGDETCVAGATMVVEQVRGAGPAWDVVREHVRLAQVGASRLLGSSARPQKPTARR